ncbi:TraB/GumN family protein [Kangiella shandongensis]|uniref:TraB/GumN family protein n=1 Tax=Kangiella shandongensis TaxID=2763258 RepID=UPI001CBE079E|nr:TraB/GumN family protein [Kangiella shandongensis]
MKKYLGIIFASLIGLSACGDDQKPDKAVKDSNSKQKVESTQSEQQPATDQTETAPQEQMADAQTADPAYKPALWKIEHNGTASYLFGSIHMGEATMYPLPQPVTQAYEASDAIAVEIDLSSINQAEMAQTVQEIAMDPDNTLVSVLSEETLSEYQEYCTETKSPCQMFNSFEPWFAAMTLEALSMQQSGYSEKYGVDMHFLSEAKKHQKDIIELETFDFQLSVFDTLPLELQDMFLYSVVTKEEDETSELVAAWKQGKVEEFVASSLLEAEEKGLDQASYEQFMDALLYKRNRGMADGIAEQIEQGKALFAVVGAAHYGGDKSINHYLEEKGFTVERVRY